MTLREARNSLVEKSCLSNVVNLSLLPFYVLPLEHNYPLFSVNLAQHYAL